MRRPCVACPLHRSRAMGLLLLVGVAGCGGDPFSVASDEVAGNTGASKSDSPTHEPSPGEGAAGAAGVATKGAGDSQSVSGSTSPNGGAPEVGTSGLAGARETPPVAGSVGVTETGGTSGAAATNGGASSTAGGPGTSFTECASRSDGPLQLEFYPDDRSATTQELHPFFRVTGNGQLIALERISIRYYFTNDSPKSEVSTCYFVTGNLCQDFVAEFGSVPKPTATATRYLEIHFLPGTPASAGAVEPIEVHASVAAGYDVLRQTNDYSFDPNASAPTPTNPTPYERWMRATLYVDGVLVWGSEPCQVTSPTTSTSRP